jgi:hypothetical protein
MKLPRAILFDIRVHSPVPINHLCHPEVSSNRDQRDDLVLAQIAPMQKIAGV